MSYVYDLDTQLPLKFHKNGKPVKLGCINVAQCQADASKFERIGAKYIRFSGDALLLTKHIMLPILIKRFPGIDWQGVLDIKRKAAIKVTEFSTLVRQDEEAPNFVEDKGISDVNTEEYRMFQGSHAELEKRQCSIEEYYADLENLVDVEMLMQLQMLPRFMSTIMETSLLQADDIYWEEGYNKKLGLYTGKYNDQLQGRNLLIIDCSASIPRPVSSALLSMAEALRDKLVADVIFTAGRSYFYQYGQELPSPQELRDKLPLGNESTMFKGILKGDILGKEWDNIVVFGDHDHPGMTQGGAWTKAAQGTKVGHVWFMFVPWDARYADDTKEMVPGYGDWIMQLTEPQHIEYVQSWVKDFNKRS